MNIPENLFELFNLRKKIEITDISKNELEEVIANPVEKDSFILIPPVINPYSDLKEFLALFPTLKISKFQQVEIMAGLCDAYLYYKYNKETENWTIIVSFIKF